jgi:hypothetical protein
MLKLFNACHLAIVLQLAQGLRKVVIKQGKGSRHRVKDKKRFY